MRSGATPSTAHERPSNTQEKTKRHARGQDLDAYRAAYSWMQRSDEKAAMPAQHKIDILVHSSSRVNILSTCHERVKSQHASLTKREGTTKGRSGCQARRFACVRGQARVHGKTRGDARLEQAGAQGGRGRRQGTLACASR